MFRMEQICLMFIIEQIRIILDEAVHVFMTIGCYYFMTSRTRNNKWCVLCFQKVNFIIFCVSSDRFKVQ